MKKTVSIMMLALFTLLCCCLVVAGIGTAIPKGFVDFPCFVYYDEENQCVRLEGVVPPENVLQSARLQVFLNHHQVGWMGAGCNSETAATDQLQMETSTLDLEFERRGEALFVNGEPLATGETFSFTKFWQINPWVNEKMQFTNYGLVPICGSDLPERVVVIGSYGSEMSPLKGGLVTLPVLILVIVFTVLVVRMLRKKKIQQEQVPPVEADPSGKAGV